MSVSSVQIGHCNSERGRQDRPIVLAAPSETLPCDRLEVGVGLKLDGPDYAGERNRDYVMKEFSLKLPALHHLRQWVSARLLERNIRGNELNALTDISRAMHQLACRAQHE